MSRQAQGIVHPICRDVLSLVRQPPTTYSFRILHRHARAHHVVVKGDQRSSTIRTGSMRKLTSRTPRHKPFDILNLLSP